MPMEAQKLGQDIKGASPQFDTERRVASIQEIYFRQWVEMMTVQGKRKEMCRSEVPQDV